VAILAEFEEKFWLMAGKRTIPLTKQISGHKLNCIHFYDRVGKQGAWGRSMKGYRKVPIKASGECRALEAFLIFDAAKRFRAHMCEHHPQLTGLLDIRI
jgi:hypothetical protein